MIWLNGHPKVSRDDAALIRAFFARSYLQIREVDRRIAELAQDIVWEHGVRPKDAIHVATAVDVLRTIGKDFQQFDTFDDELIKHTGRIGDPPLRIGKPALQEQLFDKLP